MDDQSATPERFRAVIDALPDVVYRISRDLEILDCWPGRFAPWFVGAPQQLVGRRIDEMVEGERLTRFATAIYAALETDDVVTCEFETDSHSGGPAMYRQARYVRSGPDEVLGLTRDATVERCLRDAQRFLSDAGELLVAAPAVDPDGPVSEVLSRASEFVGSVGISVFAPSETEPERFDRVFQWSDLGATLTPPVDLRASSELTRLLDRLDGPVVLGRGDDPAVTRLLDRFGLAALGYLPLGDPRQGGFLGAGFRSVPAVIERMRFESMGRFGDLLGVVIERQRGERRRAEATQLVGSLVEHTSELIAVLEPDGALRYLSGPPADFPRPPGGCADGDLSWGSVVDEDRGDLMAAFRVALRSGNEPVPVAYRVRVGDGELRQLVGTFTNLRHVPAVEGIVLNARDVTDQRAAHAALERAAWFDAMTGLPTRDAFRADLAGRLAERGDAQGVLVVDLDHFERINDAYGHAAGDAVLNIMAERLRDLGSSKGAVARFTGDKFLLAHPARSNPELRRFAETVRRELARPVETGHARVRLSASVGALIAPSASDVDAVLRDADSALHQAKREGGDRHVVWDDTLREQIEERALLEASLLAAVDRDELEVYYQPVVDLTMGAPSGAEALVRWHRPGHGIVAPGDFLGVAEETGLVHEVDLWMLRHAIHQTAKWHDHHLNIAINLSVHELDQPDLEPAIERALETSGLAPRDLCLEITETGYAQASTYAIGLLQSLRGRGVRIAIDDFGAGYSSIDRVRRFPIDIIKIDRTFVGTIADSRRDRAVVEAIIELAHALELRVVAEGVETLRQHEVLTDLGCDQAQGFHYGPPMNATGFAAHLAGIRNPTRLRRVQ